MKSHSVARLRVGLVVLLSVLCALPALSQTATVAWDPSPTTDVTGYNVYYGLLAGTTNKLAVGNVTSTVVSGLQTGQTYFFYVTAVDAYGESDPSTLVNYYVNTAPVSWNVTGQTYANQVLPITLLGTDADNDPLTYIVVTRPSQGTLSGTAPNLFYTPAANYFGPDSFTYKVNDGKVDSTIATATISVLQPPDTTPPTVSMTSPASGAVLTGVAIVDIWASDNVGVTGVQFYANGALVVSSPTSAASFSWDTTAVANGNWVLQATATDAAGNVGTSPQVSLTVQNDKTAPTVSVIAPAAGNTVSGTVTVSVSASDNVGVTKVEYYLEGSLAGTATAAPASFSWNTTTHANGTATLYAKAYDAAGNVGTSSSISVSVQNADTTPPTVSFTSPTSGSTVSGNTPVQVTASDNVAVTQVAFSVNNTLYATTTVLPAVFAWDTTRYANGSYTLQAQASDAAGNTTTVSDPNVSVLNFTATADTTPPVVSITSPSNGATVSGSVAVGVQATDNVGLTQVNLYVDGGLVSSSMTGITTFSLDTTTLVNGRHTILVNASDATLNVGSASIQIDIENPLADTTPPAVTIASPKTGSTQTKNFTVKVSATDNVGITSIQLYLDSKLYHTSTFSTTSTSATASFSVYLSKLSRGTHSLVAKASDAAKNVGTSTAVSFTK